jgi:cytochrome c553
MHRWDARSSSQGPGKKEEGNATTSFLRKDTAFTFCASCHGEDAIFKFKYFHSIKGRMKEKPAPMAEGATIP